MSLHHASHKEAATRPLIRLDNVTLGYDRHPAVHHLTGTVEEGALVAVVGPNGSGKSTLLKGLMGLLNPFDGEIHFDGLSRRDIAYLPQQSEIERSFPATVFDLVALGLWRHAGLFGGIGHKDRHRIDDAVGAVGLSGFADRPIETLSGGQLQRALFARLLLQDARVILLDEPFTAIDSKTVTDLLAVVRRWHGERRTTIAVLHDLDMVREHFPNTLLLARQPIAFGPTETALTVENLLRARAMTEAWDDGAEWCHDHEAA